MKFVHKLIDQASDEEKEFYARQVLNLDLPQGAKPADVESAIRAAQPNIAQIFVVESTPADESMQVPGQNEMAPGRMVEAGAVAGSVGGAMQGSLGATDPRVLIRINPVESADGLGEKDIAVGVNGRIWQIRRGFDVRVPLRVLFALNNCEQDLVTHDPETFEVKVNKSMRFPVVLPEGAPPADQVRDWYERTKDEFCP